MRGESHPDTATAMQSLAQLLQAMGRSNDALKLLRKALALREKVRQQQSVRSLSSLCIPARPPTLQKHLALPSRSTWAWTTP